MDAIQKCQATEAMILCDCDPDRPDFGGTRYDDRRPPTWRGVEEGIPALVEALDDLARQTGDDRAPITWCIRADLQMGETYSDCAWAFRRFEPLWRSLEASGDTIGWHPHLWRWSDEHGCWYQETEDERWIVECLETGYESLCDAYGDHIEICRMGWEFHNNVTMRTLDRLGLQMDASAVPGRRRGPGNDRGSFRHGELDWETTGAEPYRPSVTDYRRPAADGEASLDIVEVPRTVSRSALWGVARRLRSMTAALRAGSITRALWPRRQGAYIHAPMLTSPPVAYRHLIRDWAADGATEANARPFVTAFHADELLAGAGKAYSARNALRNVQDLFGAVLHSQIVEPGDSR